MENSIPTDLIIEIVSRLPAKSAARCRCVSKPWRSILRRQGFTDLFLTRSKAYPRLLLAVRQDGEWSFYSTPQPQNPSEKSSLVVSAADFHIKFSKGTSGYNCSYASGLIYFHKMCIPREDEDLKRVICNPLTGQYVILPELPPELRGGSYSYLGFDPVNKEFKVLFMSTCMYIADNDTDHYILTLGAEELRWREIKCPFTHEPFWERICIDGVLYYSAQHGIYDVIVCFDVRSETFKFVGAESRFDQLINYKGKLGGIKLECERMFGPVELHMRVLEDVEKQEWSKYDYTLSAEIDVFNVKEYLSVHGVTATGDIVLLMKSAPARALFNAFYFNPERKTFQSVEIQGVGVDRDCKLQAFVDYVEDLSINDDAMQLKSSTF
ncbi:PREDICTED: F-box only protein 12-like isoform X1 [Camelina sativa]|uniref:F-box only protein 12-like isoform X1 n=1 Tax=Camelina sativa TaxID=90675 RepID=A0ABM0VTL3_CAMSA|nr:PREDICTED: F-box only protein 12-like isoform X1 [Camelina sativa]